MAIASFALIVVHVAAGCSSDNCEIKDIVERHLGTETLVDCSLAETFWPNRPNVTAARSCVQAALAIDMPFVVTWNLPGIDSQARYALVHAVVDDKPTFYSIESSVAEPSSVHRGTTTTACTRFEDLGSCKTLDRTLCFECVGDPERCY